MSVIGKKALALLLICMMQREIFCEPKDRYKREKPLHWKVWLL